MYTIVFAVGSYWRSTKILFLKLEDFCSGKPALEKKHIVLAIYTEKLVIFNKSFLLSTKSMVYSESVGRRMLEEKGASYGKSGVESCT